jgi:hypothetical protein
LANKSSYSCRSENCYAIIDFVLETSYYFSKIGSLDLAGDARFVVDACRFVFRRPALWAATGAP